MRLELATEQPTEPVDIQTRAAALMPGLIGDLRERVTHASVSLRDRLPGSGRRAPSGSRRRGPNQSEDRDVVSSGNLNRAYVSSNLYREDALFRSLLTSRDPRGLQVPSIPVEELVDEDEIVLAICLIVGDVVLADQLLRWQSPLV